MKPALLLVDIQQDYFPNGRMEVVGAVEASRAAKRLLDRFRATTRAAFDKGSACIVAHDACATRNLAFHGLDIPASHVHGAYMAALGAVFARVASADDIIGMLPR